jgi:hypothetical protein
MKSLHSLKLIVAIVILCFLATTKTSAQSPLERRVTVNANRQALDQVLQMISTSGNFYFAYNSNIINRDSIVTLNVSNRPVREVLNLLFPNNYEFTTTANYVILRRAPITLKLITKKAVTQDREYIITGFVIDYATGARVKDASIYEKQRLASTLTNGDGYFKLKLKSKYNRAALTVSKVDYNDTTVVISPTLKQEIYITIVPEEKPLDVAIITPYTTENAEVEPEPEEKKDSTSYPFTYERKDTSRVDRTKLGRFFATYTQRIQNLNIGNFIATRPYQISIIPGLSTHGKLSTQVINNASLNVFGGYTGGVRGGEVGGLFNMNRGYMHGAQAAGLFNLTGGYVNGTQVAGIYNLGLNDVRGVQVAGIANTVNGGLSGVQVSGIHNYIKGSVKGVQVAGISNFAGKEMNGLQVSGILNYTKKLRGVQIGLINIADTSDGYSIGLINIVFKGYHKLSLSYNEVMPLNVAFKTGNGKLYSILLAGIDPGPNDKLYSFGYGLGSEQKLTNWFSVNPELTSQYLYLGNWNSTNLLNKLSLNFNLRFGKYVSVFGGPTLNGYYSNQTQPVTNYKYNLANDLHKFSYGNIKNLTGWIGWNAGINLF